MKLGVKKNKDPMRVFKIAHNNNMGIKGVGVPIEEDPMKKKHFRRKR